MSASEKISLVIMKLVIYLSMIISAAVILLTRPAFLIQVRDGHLSPYLLLIGPGIFLLLFVAFLCLSFQEKSLNQWSLVEFLPLFLGLIVSLMLIRSSLREYEVSTSSINIGFISQFTNHTDGRIRALAILALSRFQLDDQLANSLIHRALLDKDAVVQQAAKLVIEENLGIRFKNGAEGTKQAQQIMLERFPSALLTRKGSP